MSCEKKQKYNDSYLEYGFIHVNTAGEEKLQCVICYKVLSNCSIKLLKLTLRGQPNRLGCKNNLCCLVQTHVTHAFSLISFSLV